MAGYYDAKCSLGGCTIVLESAGPSQYPIRYRVENSTPLPLRPNDVRAAAGWIINECVTGQGGKGGFVTLEFANLVAFMTNPAHPIEWLFRESIPIYEFILVLSPS